MRSKPGHIIKSLSITSPIGKITIEGSNRGVSGIKFSHRNVRYSPTEEMLRLSQELKRYFKGERVKFQVKLDLSSLLPFTKRVLKETRKIPYGETRTYREIAEAIGNPRASRAVGQALKRNPIPLIIPCHRVVSKDGGLGGFSLGLKVKKYLLELEKVL